MKLCVATNFQEDFIKTINKKDVDEIFGKLTADFIGGGRSSHVLPAVSKKKLSLHIKEAHANGLRFNYLLNSACLGNREFTRQWQKKIRGLLGWLEEIEVDSVTVTIPYLLELIKKSYPRFKVCISVSAHIANLGMAKFWEDLGADLLTLDLVHLTRDFTMLKKIRKHVGCELQLIANNSCLCCCPFGAYHSLIAAHASQPGYNQGSFLIDYCILRCRQIRIKDPVNFILSDWIRPEDVHYYEDVGIDSLKIVERSESTASLALIVNAYTKRRYDGNLADLIPSYKPKVNLKNGKIFLLALKYLLNPFAVNLTLLRKMSKITPGLEVYIDNRALDGFLDFFVQGKCLQQGACKGCGYCEGVAKRSVKLVRGYRQDMLEKYRDVLDSYLLKR